MAIGEEDDLYQLRAIASGQPEERDDGPSGSPDLSGLKSIALGKSSEEEEPSSPQIGFADPATRMRGAPTEQSDPARTFVQYGAETIINRPLRGAVNFMYQYSPDPLMGLIRKERGDSFAPGAQEGQIWQDPNLESLTDTRAEQIAAKGSETFYTAMSMFIPFTGGSKAYQTAKEVGGGFLRGTLPSYLANLGGRAADDAAKIRLGDLLYGNLPAVAKGVQGTARRAAESMPYARQAIADAPDNLTRSVVTSPVANASIEASSALGAAQGAMVMEFLAPSDENARMYGEIIGGIAAPTAVASRAVARAAQGAGSLWQGVRQAFSSAGAENRLAKTFQGMIEQFGENPQAVIQSLRRAGELGDADLPSAFRAQSDAVAAFDNYVTSKNPVYAGERKTKIENAFKQLDSSLAAAVQSGNQQDLRVAAEGFYSRYKNVFEEAVQNAQREAAIKASRFPRTDPQAPSREIESIGYDNYRRARQTENQLWSAIGNDVSVTDVSNYSRRYQEVGQQLTRDEGLPLPKQSQEILEGSPTVRDMLNAKRALGERASVARREGRYGDLQRYVSLEQAVVDDLSNIPEVGAQLIRAKSFSSALNDTFVNSYFGEVIKGRIKPGELLAGAYSGTQRRRGRFNELANVGALTRQKVNGEIELDTAVFGPNIRSEQEQFLRTKVSEFVDPETGKVQPTQLKNFVRDNNELLDAYPELRQDLQDLRTSQQVVDEVVLAQKVGETELRNSAFSRIMGDAVPAKAIARIFRENNAANRMKEAASAAKNAGKAAVDGMRSAIYEVAETSARRGGNNSVIDYKAYKDYLYSPISSGQPSPMQMMKDNGIITEAQEAAHNRLLDRGITIQQTLESKRTIEGVTEESGFLMDYLIRVQGARFGTEVGQAMGGRTLGGSLQQAQAGVRLFQRIFERMPMMKQRKLARLAADDPNFMADVLARRVTPENATALNKQLNSFLISAGLGPEIYEDTESYENKLTFDEPVN